MHPYRYQKAPNGAPRNTPRRKIVLDNDKSVNLNRIPPYVPAKQKNIPKKYSKVWVPTGRMFNLEGTIIELN